MFYLGGMTLGYLQPPAPKTARRPIPDKSADPAEAVAGKDRGDRDQEWAYAFLTPWHLLY